MCDVHERQYSDLPRQRDNQDHVVRAKCAAGLKHTYLYRRTDVLYPWRRISCRWLLRRVFLTILSRWTVAALISSVRIDSVTSSSFVDLQVTHVIKSNFSNLLAVFPTDSSKVRKKQWGRNNMFPASASCDWTQSFQVGVPRACWWCGSSCSIRVPSLKFVGLPVPCRSRRLWRLFWGSISRRVYWGRLADYRSQR